MEQSDVFVSYRRKDVEFVKQLVQNLNAKGLEVWVDWEDIPPGVEGFGDEIQRGIEAADAFIAVLSPSYLESEYCLMELREALKLKKRVVPVVFEKFDPAPPPEGIGHINWVYFTPHAGQENTFEQSFPKVTLALETDHEYARDHTRLLTRAIEWEKRQRNTSYLLKGEEIDKAETWQVNASGKDPTPTELQLAYVLQSRTQQRTQQRRITASIGVLLVLAVIAAVYAVFKANEARISAEAAHSSALASAALQPGNEEIAIALALEATRSEHAPASVYNALARVAYPAGGIRYKLAIDEGLFPFVSPAFSPDGEQVVFKDKLYDMVTGELVREFENAPEFTLTGLFLPDGKQVILAGDRDFDDSTQNPAYLGLYDVATGKLVRAFDTGIGVSEVQLSADGNTLIGYQPDSKVVWWDIRSGKKLREFETNNLLVTFSPDLKWMVEAHNPDSEIGTSELILVNADDTQDQRTLITFEAMSILLIRFSPDSKEIAIHLTEWTSNNAELVTVSLESGKIVQSFQNPPSSIASIRYSPDGMSLVTPVNDQSVLLWNRSTGKVETKQTAHRSPVIFADFTPKDGRIISMDDSGIIIVWDYIPGNLDQRVPTEEGLRAITPDGYYLISEGYNPDYETDKIIVWDTRTLNEVSRLPIQKGTTIHSYFLADGLEKGIFCYSTNKVSQDVFSISEIHIASLSDGLVKQTWKNDTDFISYINKAQISPKGDQLYILYTDKDNRSHLEVWNIASGKVTNAYITSEYGNFNFAINPAGTRLLITANIQNENEEMISSYTQMVDTANKDVLFSLDGQTPATMFFTPDGSQFGLVMGNSYGEVRSYITVYDAQTAKIVHEYAINMEASSDFEIQPDNRSFVTSFGGGGGGGGGEGTPSGIFFGSSIVLEGSTIRWDFATGELLWQFPNPSSESFFSPDGTRLYNSSFNHLQVWRLDSPKELIAWACANRYVPEFSDVTRVRFDVENNVSVCDSK